MHACVYRNLKPKANTVHYQVSNHSDDEWYRNRSAWSYNYKDIVLCGIVKIVIDVISIDNLTVIVGKHAIACCSTSSNDCHAYVYCGLSYSISNQLVILSIHLSFIFPVFLLENVKRSATESILFVGSLLFVDFACGGACYTSQQRGN